MDQNKDTCPKHKCPLETYEHPHNGDELELCPKCYREAVNSKQGLDRMG